MHNANKFKMYKLTLKQNNFTPYKTITCPKRCGKKRSVKDFCIHNKQMPYSTNTPWERKKTKQS